MAGQRTRSIHPHILVVEDEKQWREDTFREVLEDEGYQVKTASNYSEAVAEIDRTVFDLAVIDINLTAVPGNKDGIRVLEYMADQGHQTRAIIVSGSKAWAAAEEYARRFNPVAFFDKTRFDVVEFLTRVTEAIAP
jgi:DNA-binding NtrC family response regulator